MNNDDRNMNSGVSNMSGSGAQSEQLGYHTAGEDTTLQSSGDAVPVPIETSEQRLTDPQPVIQSIGEKPGDANPALAETIGMEQGQVSTADLLLAREVAEEQPVRGRGLESYGDQSAGAQSDEFQNTDAGRPNWPDDRNVEPAEYVESPRADMPFGTGAPEYFDVNFKGRADAEIDRSVTQASASDSRSGLAPVGADVTEDKYEHREFDRPEPPSDMDLLAPGMVNLAPEDDNG